MSAPQKLAFLVKAWKWKDRAIAARAKVRDTRYSGPSGRPWDFTTAHRVTEYEGDFRVEIDVPALVDLMVRRCQNTKRGRSDMLEGLATAVRLTQRGVSSTIEPVPMPEYLERVEDGREPAQQPKQG